VTLSGGRATAAANACFKAANAINAATVTSLNTYGCHFQGHSVLISPALGTFGTAGRSNWRDSGLRNWDLSFIKSWKFQDRLTAQFRAEFFNVLNHPNFANPCGASNGFGPTAFADPYFNRQFRLRLCDTRSGRGQPGTWIRRQPRNSVGLEVDFLVTVSIGGDAFESR